MPPYEQVADQARPAGHRRRPGEGPHRAPGGGAEGQDRGQPEVRLVPQEGRARPAWCPPESGATATDRRRRSTPRPARRPARRTAVEPVAPPSDGSWWSGSARPGPTCSRSAAVAAIDRVAARPAVPAHHPSPGGGRRRRGRGQLRPHVRVGGHARRRLRRHRRRPGRGGRRARRGPLRGARVAAGGRAHRRAAAGRRPGDGRAGAGHVVPRPGVGPRWASTRWRRACGWSTATGSRSRRPASGGRCWWPSATPRRCCPTSSWRSSDLRRPDGGRAPPPGPARRVGAHRGLGRPRPRRRARPPHVGLRPGAGRRRWPARWPASPSWSAPCASAAPGTGSRPTPPSPATCWRRPTRCWRRSRRSTRPTTASGFDHLEEELGDLLFQVVFHATLAAEEGHFTLADVARGIHDKLVHRHPHVFGDVRGRHARRGRAELGADQEGGEGPHQPHGRDRGRPALAPLRPQGAAQGRVGRPGSRSPTARRPVTAGSATGRRRAAPVRGRRPDPAGRGRPRGRPAGHHRPLPRPLHGHRDGPRPSGGSTWAASTGLRSPGCGDSRNRLGTTDG